jgi:hypothetical protein
MERVFPAALSNWKWKTPVKDVLKFTSLPSRVTLGMLMADGSGSCNIPQDDDEDRRDRRDREDREDKKDYGNYSSTKEVHWICAILNAAVLYPARFPYSASKIQDVANGTDTSIDREALYTLLTSLEGTGGL